MPKAGINGIELYYESHGQGPAIVFAHGRGGNHLSWWQQVPVFSQDYRCITFDHRGWGQSVEPTGGPGNHAFVEDLKQLLDMLEVDQTFLVAQSMGGLTCLGFALAYPERTLGLVLGDTTGGAGDPAVQEALKDVHPPSAGPERTLSRSFIRNRPDLTFLYQEVGAMNPVQPTNTISPAFRAADAPRAAGLSVPTLMIVGEEDLIFPPHVVRALHGVVPGSRLEVVAGAAHSTHFEQPEKFNRLVGEFFAGVQAGKAVAAAG